MINTAVPDATAIADCPEKHFVFENLTELRKYWFDLEWICLNTPASKKSCETALKMIILWICMSK